MDDVDFALLLLAKDVDPDSINAICNAMRNAIFIGFFLTPLPTMWKIWEHKSVAHFSPTLYLATLLNCMMWFFYGRPMVNPDSTLLVSTINGVGIFLEAAYIILFFIFSNRKLRLKMTKILLAEAAFTAAAVAVVLSVLHTHSQRSLLVGIVAGVFSVIMRAAPLSVMIRTGSKTKRVKYTPLYQSAVPGILNDICWAAYTLFDHFDPFIAIPHGLGALLGLVHLMYVNCYTPLRDEDQDRPYITPAAGGGC